MKIRATDEQIVRMLALAATASTPMGLGFLHFQPGPVLDDDVKGYVNERGAFIDYHEGRMVKLRMWQQDDGTWEVPDEIRPDYESWISTYPSYRELAEAAGAEVI